MIILMLVMYTSALVPSFLFYDVGVVLMVTGTVAGSLLSYFGPRVVYLRIHGRMFMRNMRERWGVVGKMRRFLRTWWRVWAPMKARAFLMIMWRELAVQDNPREVAPECDV